jgi:molecular chaperone DnaK (HSP70)
MSLDVDGILHVTAIEKSTGKSKHITVDRALEKKSDAELQVARKRLEALYSHRPAEDAELELEPAVTRHDEKAGQEPAVGKSTASSEISRQASDTVDRCRRLLAQMHEEDRQEAIDLNQRIEAAMASNDEQALKGTTEELSELLFFVEGKA